MVDPRTIGAADLVTQVNDALSGVTTVDVNLVAAILTRLFVDGVPSTGDLTGHTDDHTNPHAVTAAQVSAYTKTEIDSALALLMPRTDTRTNVLDNPSLAINQRGFAGGALATNVFGFDRWRGGASGATVSVAAGVVTLAAGSIIQVVEDPGMAGETVTASVNNPTSPLTVTLTANGNTVSGTIQSGSGRKSVTLSLPAGATGNLSVEIAASVSTSFSDAQLQIGSAATPFRRRHPAIEEMRCQRFFVPGLWFASAGYANSSTDGSGFWVEVNFPVPMADVPDIAITVVADRNRTAATEVVLSANRTSCILSSGNPAAGSVGIAWRGTITATAELLA